MARRKTNKSVGQIAIALLVLLAAALLYDRLSTGTPGGDPVATSETAGESAILTAFQEKRSGLMVEAAGIVDRILADDLEGDRHQRFIVRLASDHTLLLSHNIDLAPRVPISRGDSVRFRGQYEWNSQGGVIHWTHHDPQGRRPGGWIRLRGASYR